MDDADAAPLEDAFPEPILPRSLTRKIRSRGDLRHVDDALDSRLFCRDGKNGECFEQPFCKRIHEVGARDPAHGATHGLDVS